MWWNQTACQHGFPVGMRVPRQKEVVPGQDVVDVIIVSIDAKFGPLVSRVGLYDCLLARLLDGLLVETLSERRSKNTNSSWKLMVANARQ